MSKSAQFTIAFNIQTTNEERLEMAGLYQKAFHAEILSESTPPDSDAIHIMIDIYGLQILIGPGNAAGNGLNNPIVCEARFCNEEEFYNAYNM